MGGVTQTNVNDVQATLDRHVSSVVTSLSDMERSYKDSMDNHTNDVKLMFEKEVNPINAYLNTMHIKADSTRAELDSLSLQMPKIQASVTDAFSQLDRVE